MYRKRPTRLSLRTLFALSAAALPQVARATTYTFTAAVSDFWNDPLNWSPHGVPTPGDSANVGTGGSNYVTDPQYADFVTLNGGFLEILSNSTFAYGTLTASRDVNVNAGHLQLIGQEGFYSGLNARMVNIAAGAFFDIKALTDNNAVYHSVQGDVANQGTTAIDGSVFFGGSTVTNTNVMTIGSGATASFASGSVVQTGGSLAFGGGSTLYLAGGGFLWSGGSISNTAAANALGLATGGGGAVSVFAGSLLLNVANGGGATFSVYNTSTLYGDLPVNTTLEGFSNSSWGYLNLTVTDQARIQGTMNLHSNNGFSASLICPDAANSGGTGNFINDGTLNLLSDGSSVSNQANIIGHMTNTGTVNAAVNTFLAFNVTNTGSFNVSPGVTVSGTSMRLNQNAGTLGNSGNEHLKLSSCTFNYNGGDVYLTVDLTNCALNLNVSSTPGTAFNAAGTNTLGTDLPANTALFPTASSPNGYGNLFVPLNFTNHGHLFFHAVDGFTSTLYAGPSGGGTIANAALMEFATNVPANTTSSASTLSGALSNTGTINSDVDLYLSGNTTNTGSFNIGNNATLHMTSASFNQNAGNLGNSGNTHFALTSGAFHYNGGTVNLTVDLYGDSSLTTPVANGHATVFNFKPGSNGFVFGNLAANTTVFSAAQGAYSNLYVDDAAHNNGSITVYASGGFSNNLYVGDGSDVRDYFNHGTLSLNAADKNSAVTVWGRLWNYGTLNASGDVAITAGLQLADGSTINTSGPSTHVNIAGPIVLLNANLISQDGAGLISQDGGGIVSQGAGNIVSQGAGNITAKGGIVSQGAGNLIAQDGGSIVATGGGNISVQGGKIVAQGAGNLVSHDGGSLVSHDGGSMHVGFGSFLGAWFVGHNGSAAPGGVVSSDDRVQAAVTSTIPQASIVAEANSTISLEGGSLQADNVVRVDAGAILTGAGSVTASSVLSAGTIAPSPGGTITIDAPVAITAGSINGPGGALQVNSALRISTGSPFTVQASSLSAVSLTLTAPTTLDLTTTTLTLSDINSSALLQLLSTHTLFSSTADADPAHLLTLGYLFDGGSQGRVEMTYAGDANLNGRIDPDDYALLDRGLAAPASLWQDGDFNYDGVIDALDYLLIDKSFVLQGNALGADFLSQRESRFGSGYVSALLASVPEPGTCFAALISVLATRRRRDASSDVA